MLEKYKPALVYCLNSIFALWNFGYIICDARCACILYGDLGM